MIHRAEFSSQYLDQGAVIGLFVPQSPIADGKILAILDVYQIRTENGFQTEVIFPPQVNPRFLVTHSKFRAENVAEISVRFESFLRGTKAIITSTEPLGEFSWSIQDASLKLVANESNLDAFGEKNAAILYSNGDHPRIVAEWINFHQKEHGLQAVCIVRSESWGNISQKFGNQLQKHLGESDVDIWLIETDAPLGKNAPPARALCEAPDAPGKQRENIPPNDPWRSELASAQIYEICRNRFLNEARAVLNLSPSDLIKKRGGQSIFDHCVSSEQGYLQLFGERVFPWRIRVGQKQAKFEDHCCHRFDSTELNRAWCVVPNGPKASRVWNLYRVGKAADEYEPFQVFWRFMALRHDDPESNNPTLVPKTAIILYPELLEFVQNEFGGKPVLPPEKEEEIKAIPAAKAGRRCIVTTMKNEGPFLLEWIAFHRAIGFDDFVVYTNDCTDGTDEFLDLLQAKGMVEHYDNPYREVDLKPQHAALFDSARHPTVQNADWLICMDCDEFVNIKTGDGTLDALFEKVGNANFISLTWRLFGNTDVGPYVDKPIIEQFTQCAFEETRFPHQAWGVKTLYRNQGIFKKMGVHRPKGLKSEYIDHINWVNGSGKPLPIKFIRNGWRTGLASYGYDLVQLNHYACRSMESFLVKRDRGRVNHVDRDQGLKYWFRMNHNPDEDRSILDKLPLFHAELERLMSDPEIKAQHEACVKAHQQRIDELLEQENYQKFYDEINSSRLRELSKLLPHFGMNVFLIGPEAINDELMEKLKDGEIKYYNPPASHVNDGSH